MLNSIARPPLSPTSNSPIHERMTDYLLALEERIQSGRVRRPIGEKPDPHGRVDQDHQAIFRFAGAFSRRLGVSRASGSDPRSERRRWYAS